MTYFTTLLLALLFSVQAFGAGTTDQNFSIGKGASNKTLTFNKGLGATNPKIRWNNATSKIEVSNDGVTYVSVGSSLPPSAISASDIDWGSGNVFTKTLSANTTFTFSNRSSGQTIVVRLTNTASNYTVTWPVAVLWSGGTAPTQTIGVKSDVYTFIHDGTTTYGSVVQDF